MNKQLFLILILSICASRIISDSSVEHDEDHHYTNETDSAESITAESPEETVYPPSTDEITKENSSSEDEPGNDNIESTPSTSEDLDLNPPIYAIPLRDNCPPLSLTCPKCLTDLNELTPEICEFRVVLKVLLLSSPQIDSFGRICGKFGMLSAHRGTDQREFRRLLRFSLKESCGCQLIASRHYFLMSHHRAFLNQGHLYNKVLLSEDTILFSVDWYSEVEILKYLESCPTLNVTTRVPPQAEEEKLQPRMSSKSNPPPPRNNHKPPIHRHVYPSSTIKSFTTSRTLKPVKSSNLQPRNAHENPDFAQTRMHLYYSHDEDSTESPPRVPLHNIPRYGIPPPYAPPTYIQPPYVPPQYPPPVPYQQTTYAPSQYIQAPPPYTSPRPSYPAPPPVLYDHQSYAQLLQAPVLTSCMQPPTCPDVCGRIDGIADFPKAYCTADYALLSAVIFPDRSLFNRGGKELHYNAGSCLKLQTKVVYDVSKGKDPKKLRLDLSLLLPSNCYCFPYIKGPQFVLLLGFYEPFPYAPAYQLTKNHHLFWMPAPSNIVLPNCVPYPPPMPYASPPNGHPPAPVYLQPPVMYTPAAQNASYPGSSQPYEASNCPYGIQESCPECLGSLEQWLIPLFCSSQFAVVAEVQNTGPHLLSYSFPTVTVTVTKTYLTRNVVISISNPSRNRCIQGSLKVIQRIKPTSSPYSAPENIIPFVALAECACPLLEKRAGEKLLVFSSEMPSFLLNGALQLTKDIYITPIPAYAPLPNCASTYDNEYDFSLSSVYNKTPAPVVYTPPPYKPLPPPVYTPPPPPPVYETPFPPVYTPPPPPPVYETPAPPVYSPPPPPPAYKTLSPPAYTPPPPPYKTPSPPVYTPPPVYKTPAPPVYTPPQPPPVYETPSPPIYKTPAPPVYTSQPINVVEPIPVYKTPAQPDYTPQPQPPVPYSLPIAQFPPPPSFAACPLASRSCPTCAAVLPQNFADFYCLSQYAVIVAIGLDYNVLQREKEDPRILPFIPAEPPHLDLNYDNYSYVYNVTVTRAKTVKRRNNKPSYENVCYREKVRGLYDVSRTYQPYEQFSELDLYIPARCDCETLDLSPAFGVLLSQTRPYYLDQPIQLTDKFAFFPLPHSKIALPDCYTPPQVSPYHASNFLSATRYNVPTYSVHKQQVDCELGGCVEDCYLNPPGQAVIPCDAKVAVLIEILETSAGPYVVPTLEISKYQSEYYAPTVWLHVKSNEPPPKQAAYGENAAIYKDCKYLKAKVVQDFSPYPTLKKGDIFTITAGSDCNHKLFRKANGYALLITHTPVSPNAAISLNGNTLKCIPSGTTKITPCSASATYKPQAPVSYQPPSPVTYQPPSPVTYQPPSPVTYQPPSPVTYQPPSPVTYQPPSPKTYEPPVTNRYTTPAHITYKPSPVTHDTFYDPPPTSEPYRPVSDVPDCPNHQDNSCPVCVGSDFLTPQAYCKAKMTLMLKSTGKVSEEHSNCMSGVVYSVYDLTAGKGATKAILTVLFTIPKHCTCQALDGNGFTLLLVNGQVPDLTNPLEFQFSNQMELYSLSPGKVTLPGCKVDDAYPRTDGNQEQIQMRLDTIDNELTSLMKPRSDLTECPTVFHTCPECHSMEDDDQLKDFACSSDIVYKVSTQKKKNGSKAPPEHETVSVIQNTAGNHTVDVTIRSYEHEDVCSLPYKRGTCNASITRYYFDPELEICIEFNYTGCEGNANNFKTEGECEEVCSKNDLCLEGKLENEKGIKVSDDDLEPFHYAVPEYCKCPYLQSSGALGYLVYNMSSAQFGDVMQLTKDFYLIPLSDSQKENEISCSSDISDESQDPWDKNDDSLDLDATDPDVTSTVKSNEKGGWFKRLI